MWTRVDRVGLLWMAALAITALAGAGCESGPYLSAYSYYPHATAVDVFKRGTEQQEPPLRTTAMVLGVRRPDPDHHVGPAIDVRFQLESDSPEPASFDPSSLSLVNGMLQPFPRPYVNPPSAVTLSEGQQAEITASFPLPPNIKPEQIDLNELRLRWIVHVGRFQVPQTALFERAGAGYSGPDYQPAPGPGSPSDVAY